jgi:hypothetical protein
MVPTTELQVQPPPLSNTKSSIDIEVTVQRLGHIPSIQNRYASNPAYIENVALHIYIYILLTSLFKKT